MQRKISKYYKFAGLFFILFFISTPVLAAEIFFGAAGKTLPAGRLTEIGVFLSSGNEPLNAVEGTLVFAAGKVRLDQVIIAKSAVNLWVVEPKVQADGNQVKFSGILPGGTQGFLFSLFVTPLEPGPMDVTIENGRVLLNDGRGTPQRLTVAPLQVTVTDVPGGATTSPPVVPQDLKPPKAFTVQIARDGKLFENRWFASFVAYDDETGIDHYEVQEHDSKEPQSGGWQRTASPYVLKDQSRKSYLSVKAVDKAKNETISVVAPATLVGEKQYSKTQIWLIIVTALVLTAGVVLWRKKRRKQYTFAENKTKN